MVELLFQNPQPQVLALQQTPFLLWRQTCCGE
jgi:hypothetical protein